MVHPYNSRSEETCWRWVFVCLSLWFRFAFTSVGLPNESVKYESFVIHMDHQEHLGEGMPGSKWLWQRNLLSRTVTAKSREVNLQPLIIFPSAWKKPLLCLWHGLLNHCIPTENKTGVPCLLQAMGLTWAKLFQAALIPMAPTPLQLWQFR